MKKLFAVEIEGEIVVAAESGDDAVKIANALIDNYNAFKDDLSAVHSRMITRAAEIPYPWDAGCLPYGPSDNRLIGDYLEAAE